MKQLNVPKKLTSQIQVWTSVLLLIVATFLSLAPIITLKTNMDNINEMLDKVAEDTTFDLGEIPETVDVSAIKIVKSIGVVAKITKATMNAAKGIAKNAKDAVDSANNLGNLKDDMSNPQLDNLDEFQNSASNAVDEIEKMESTMADTQKKADDLGAEITAILETDEGKETLLIALSLGATVASNFNTDDMSGTGVLASVLTMLITLIALIALLVLTFVIPIMLLINSLISLITALAHLRTPEDAAPKVSKKLIGFISLPFTMMLFQCVVPGMTYGKGIVGICIVTILSAVLGLVISRLRSYEGPAFRYLNIVQGVSALGIVGFMIFFFNLVKTNVLTSFLNGKLAEYVALIAEATARAKKMNMEIVTHNEYLMDLGLILVYLFLALGSVAYLEKCAQRLACSAVANKKGSVAKDTAIVRAILMIAIYAIPAYIMGQKHFYNDPTLMNAEGDASFLVLETAEQNDALKMVLVGAILMVVAEVALIVLKMVFCKGMNRSEIAAVMTGAAETEVAEPAIEEAATETAEIDEAAETESESETETAEETAEETVEETDEEASEEVAEEVAQ